MEILVQVELFLECLCIKYVWDMERKAFVNSEVDCRWRLFMRKLYISVKGVEVMEKGI